jgi:hypothetical protein
MTRNDFCKSTDTRLQTPLQREFARHLHVTNFSQSIACMLAEPSEKCDVCQPVARGFIEAIFAMPRLSTVLIGNRKRTLEVEQFRERFVANNEVEVCSITDIDTYVCCVPGSIAGALRIRFING